MPVSQPIPTVCHCEEARWADAAIPTRLLRYARNDTVLRSVSRLFQLDQGAAEILGVEEEHRLAVGPDFWLAVAEHAGARCAQAITRGDDVADLEAQMVHAAGRVLVEKAPHRRAGAERLQQLDLAERQLDEHHGDAVF